MNYTMTTFSPVHIGTGKKITPFESFVTNKTFAVVDLPKILNGRIDRADALNNKISEDGARFSLSKFLTSDEKQQVSCWKYSAALDDAAGTAFYEELRNTGNVDVAEQIKTPSDSSLYIPGSSLKGAFRTAWAYFTFHSDSELFAELTTRLKHDRDQRANEAVNELVFGGVKYDSKYDLFKTLHITDSSPLPANTRTLEIGKMKILSLISSQQEKALGTLASQFQALNFVVSGQSPLKIGWTLQEALRPGNAFHGNIRIEHPLLNDNILGWNARQRELTPQRLFLAANTFSRDICEWELNFFSNQVRNLDVGPVINFYHDLKQQIEEADERTAYLCIGYGAGWHKTTLGLLLQQAHHFDFKGFREAFQMAEDRLQFEFPKSRKLLMAARDDILAVYGWVKISVV